LETVIVKKHFDNPKISRSCKYYGSIKTRTNDKYSDIDLEITPSNSKYLYSNFKKIIKNIADYFIIFPVLIDQNLQTFTIVWKGKPLYKKLDLRINAKINPNLAKKACGFDENLKPFYNLFIGAVRFVKYRKRKELISSMKFYKSAHEYLVKIYPESKLLHKYFFLKDDKQVDEYFIEMLKIYQKTLPDNEFAVNVIKFTENELLEKRN